jgi:hypothetical protein
MFKANTPSPAQRRAELDKDDLELAEREEALAAELSKLSLPTGKQGVVEWTPRKKEIASAREEIHAARASIREQCDELLKEEEREVHASLQAPVDAEYRKLAPALSQVLASLKEIAAIEKKLHDRGFGTAKVCPIDTSDIVISDLGDVLRQLAAKGFAR